MRKIAHCPAGSCCSRLCTPRSTVDSPGAALLRSSCRGIILVINRRTFSAALVAGAAASLAATRGMGATAPAIKARNVVLVHGLFADGSSWSEVIPRLQAAGLNATSVQNPLTTLPEAVAPAQRVLAPSRPGSLSR